MVHKALSDKSQLSNGIRAALFVDGFNLYHPLCQLGKNHLKWLDLWSLGELIARDRSHELVSVTYCTAFQKDSPEQTGRHRKYINALKSVGVEVVLGHYIMSESKPCFHCGSKSNYPTEKQTDINLALSVYADAMKNSFDWAYVLSADSDQAATANFMKRDFPDKKLVTVSPPNRPVSEKVLSAAAGKRRLNEEDIIKCRLPDYFKLPSGNLVRCPIEYSLPS